MKSAIVKLPIIVFGLCFAPGANAASSESEASHAALQTPRGVQIAKSSPASKAFGNPFKSPSEAALDFGSTGSISTNGKTPPSADGKTGEGPSMTTRPAQKKN